MKTPEEIKKGLECCNNMADGCMKCPYETEVEFGWHCVVERNIDALAYIEQLEDGIDRIYKLAKDIKVPTTNPEWISVKEKLPETHGQKCVGLYSQHGDDRPYPYPHVFTWNAYGDNGYVNGPHFSDEGLDGLKVHYWMPLPEAPKEEITNEN